MASVFFFLFFFYESARGGGFVCVRMTRERVATIIITCGRRRVVYLECGYIEESIHHSEN